VDVTDDALTIFDGKGRPGQGPRAHQIPLVKVVREDLARLKRDGEFAVSTTAGKKPISVRTLAGWAHDIVGASIEDFQLKRIRSGIETLLASMGVSREVRGHLQSHGLTGVQARHYDGHDYMPEKLGALDILVKELCGTEILKRGITVAGQPGAQLRRPAASREPRHWTPSRSLRRPAACARR
jgi:hypothetical protein